MVTIAGTQLTHTHDHPSKFGTTELSNPKLPATWSGTPDDTTAYKTMAKTAAATEDSKVGAGWRYSAKGARYATHATVKVSGFVANRVGRLTKGLANYLATKAERPITGAVTTATGGAQSKSSSMHNLVDAARGGLVAFGTVYAGLEESAKVLGGSVKDNSVKVRCK